MSTLFDGTGLMSSKSHGKSATIFFEHTTATSKPKTGNDAVAGMTLSMRHCKLNLCELQLLHASTDETTKLDRHAVGHCWLSQTLLLAFSMKCPQ